MTGFHDSIPADFAHNNSLRTPPMEYLTLRDVPHSHFNPVRARRMASPDEKARALPSMAAVRDSCSRLPSSFDLRPASAFQLLSPPSSKHSFSSLQDAHSPSRSTSIFLPPPVSLNTTARPRLDSLYCGQEVLEVPPDTEQNYHMRHSPPLQPDDQRPVQNPLPSFSEVSETAMLLHCHGLTRRS